MLSFVFQKMKNKKWLNLCLAVGICLLMAVFICHPVLEEQSDNRILENGFKEYVEKNEEFPAVLLRSDSCLTEDYPTTESLLKRMEQYEDKWTEYVKLDPVSSQHIMTLSGSSANTNFGGNNQLYQIAFMENMDSHVDVVKAAEGNIEAEYACYISESVMDFYGLVVGEVITFSHVSDDQGNPLTLTIAGIIREKEEETNFWYYELADYEKTLFVSQQTFDRMLESYGFSQISWQEALLLDYRGMNSDNAFLYKSYLEAFSQKDVFFSTNLTEQLEDFANQHDKTQMILWVMELPCMVLLLLFIYMVSKQIVELEEGEIAVLRSRGTTRFQIMNLYLIQAVLLSLIGILAGFLIGLKVVPYVMIAMVIAVIFMLLPVWKKSNLTIVEQKSQNKYEGKTPFWQKFFLDFLLLGVSGYLLFNYYKQQDELSASVLAGESLDPVLFLNSSLFLFAGSLVVIRLVGYLLKGIYYLGRKHWKPGMYAAFLQMIRTFHKQSLLWIFLIVTIASGIFQTNMAQTVNQNTQERIIYDVGTDLILMEKWKMQTSKNDDGSWAWSYEEPSYEFYEELEKDGKIDSVTRVLEDGNIDISANGKSVKGASLMAISTKTFGETAQLQDGLNSEHWYYSLNALATEPEGAIISRNLAEKMELSVGDKLIYSRYSPVLAAKDQSIGADTVKVSAIVDAFPGYNRYTEDGEENYMIICNLAAVTDKFSMTPYSVWVKLNEGDSADFLREMAEEQGISFTSWNSLEENLKESTGSSMIQITNILFQISFLISMIICVTGYLIYWIMSIQSRELLFGIYRAMGMGIKKVYGMVFTEQIICFAGAVTAGGAMGMLASVLFIPLLALVYLPEKHNISITMHFLGMDLLQIAAVLLVAAVICFVVLLRILKNMKIAQALKMGED